MRRGRTRPRLRWGQTNVNVDLRLPIPIASRHQTPKKMSIRRLICGPRTVLGRPRSSHGLRKYDQLRSSPQETGGIYISMLSSERGVRHTPPLLRYYHHQSTVSPSMAQSTENAASAANLHKEISHLRHELKTTAESHPASSERIRIGDYLIERLAQLGVTVRPPSENAHHQSA